MIEDYRDLEPIPEHGNDFIADVSGSDFWVECNVCKQQLKNWTGSTPCCGSIAYMVEAGKATNKANGD